MTIDIDVLIIGAGPSGIGAAVRLLRAGRRDLLVLEKGSSPGGTWRENHYPGVACDVPSTLYSYSFAPKPDWSRAYADGPEIRRYIETVARDYGVEQHIRLGCTMLSARWDPGEARWLVDTTDGSFRARALISAAGPLHEPSIPDVPGLDAFAGAAFHTARWDHEHDLAGRCVAVVGTGASAIQVIPKIAPIARHLTVVQRTPPWVLPKPDHAIHPLEQAVLRHVPGVQAALRQVLYHGFELVQLAQRHPQVMRQIQRLAELHLRLRVRDRTLREALTPSFVLGCKRILMSNSYYSALQRENVTVVPHALTRLNRRSIRTADGTTHRAETVIFATGFEATDPPIAKHVRDADNRTLASIWNGSPTAYRGTMAAGFPNLFFLIGPNTGNGHSSAFVVLEAQLDLIVRVLDAADAPGRGVALAPTPEAQDAWDADVQAALQGTVWNVGGCDSWYIDNQGRNSTIYPWTTIDLRRRCRQLILDDFAAQSPSVSARTANLETRRA